MWSNTASSSASNLPKALNLLYLRIIIGPLDRFPLRSTAAKQYSSQFENRFGHQLTRIRESTVTNPINQKSTIQVNHCSYPWQDNYRLAALE